MSTSLSFKIYLKREGEQPEIRRFLLERDVATNYAYLRQKIYTLFPALQSVGFNVSWKDADQDEVLICTDEELLIALNEMVDVNSGYKLYVTPGAQAKKSPLNIVHEGVVCDSCDREVTGYRYKCVVCPDYDLCSECEHKYNHKEHIMLRFPFTVARDVHMRRKLLKEMFKFTKHCDAFPGDQPTHRRHHNKFHHRRGPPPPFDEDYPRKCPFNFTCETENDWGEMAQTFVSNLKSSVDSVSPVLIQEIVSALNNLRCDEEPSSNEHKKAKPDKDDKHVHFEQQGEASTSKTAEKDQQQAPSQAGPSTPKPDDGPKVPPPQVPNFVDLAHSFLNPIINQINHVDPSLVPNIMQTLNGFNPTSSAPPAQPATQNAATSPERTPAATKETQVENRESPTVDGFVNIGMDEDVITLNPSPTATNPQIEAGLQKMLAMGFNNEGNWLKEMLIVCNGDINRVLEMISQSVQEQKKQPN